MRFLLLVVALVAALLAAPSAQAQRDWRTTVRQTPAGAYVIGNPAAKVKLVEYLSYTCSHCADFVAASKPVLVDGMVKNGSVSLEVRHAVRDGLDLASAMLVRCTGPANFLAAHTAVFANQPKILDAATKLTPPENVPPAQALATLAEGSGVTGLVQARLKTQPAACLGNKAEQDRLTAMARDAFSKIRGTPSFAINGELVQGVDWAGLEPKLRAAGAR